MGSARDAVAARMISVDIKEKRFAATCVLKDVQFELQPGEILAVTGPSGVGKTTLLRILAGLDTDFDGHVSRPEDMAMVFQEPTLLPWRSVLQNICLVARAEPAEARAILAEVGLAGREGDYPGQLSLGQQRRLALARALAARPELLLLDEPFVSLDPELAGVMIDLTVKLLAERRITSVFVTHSPAEAKRLATRSLHLKALD